ncbi:MAG TPA: hypothetical protein VJ986_13915 [Gaiellaceae bacterium]|nr:hypothetical protein [Gaiellaceae bacterium]
MTLHLIADDLRDHAWYESLFVETIHDVEAFAARWAAFEQLVAVYGDAPDDDEPSGLF